MSEDDYGEYEEGEDYDEPPLPPPEPAQSRRK